MYLLSLVIRLLANAVNLTIFTSISAFVTYVLSHCFGHCLRNANARAMEPIAANVTTNIKPKSKKGLKSFFQLIKKLVLLFRIIWCFANAIKFFPFYSFWKRWKGIACP